MLYLDSGHGGQAKDVDGDEGDGYDEGSFFNGHVTNDINLPLSHLSGTAHRRCFHSSLTFLQVDFEQNGHIVDDVDFLF